MRVYGPRLIATAASLAAVLSCADTSVVSKPEITRNPDVTQDRVSTTNMVIDRQKILQSHNAIRQRLGIPPLRWSTQLESYASDWANYLVDAGCTVRRRGLVGLPAHKNGLGENLQFHDPMRWDDGRAEIAEIDENEVVISWARQGIDYDYKNNTCALNKECENYTQVVWRDSQVLGCAAASCPNSEQIWVCNYDPPGNYFNQKPY